MLSIQQEMEDQFLRSEKGMKDIMVRYCGRCLGRTEHTIERVEDSEGAILIKNPVCNNCGTDNTI